MEDMMQRITKELIKKLSKSIGADFAVASISVPFQISDVDFFVDSISIMFSDMIR